MLQRMFTASPFPTALLEGKEHLIVWANEPFLRIMGRSELPAERYDDLSSRLPGLGEALHAVLTSGEGAAIPLVLTINGEERHTTALLLPVGGGSGTPDGVILQAVEATSTHERHSQVELQRILTRTVADNVSSSLVVLDPTGRPLYMNAAAEEITGYTLAEARDHTFHDLVHHRYPDGTPFPSHDCVLLAALSQMTPLRRHRDMLINRAGDYVPVLVDFIPVLADDRLEAGVLEFRDMTLETRIEEERVLLLDAERAARAEAEAAVHARDEFLSIAAHELRNPVTAVKGAAQFARRAIERGETRPGQLASTMAMIERNVNRLIGLVDDLLDVSRLQSHHLRVRRVPTDIVTLLLESVATIRAQGYSVEFVGSAQPHIMDLDPDRIEQVLANLLENAVKYSPEGGTIEVTLQRAEDGVEITVRDQGIGIPPDELERIFEPFGRASNAQQTSIPGMGLGLYICRQIASAHGGELRAESSGTGAVMRLTLPSASPH